MHTPLLQRNIIANFLGRSSAAVISLLAIPFYIRFLGVEAYGLIGFFTTVLTLSAVFDLGLSSTANREVARLTALISDAWKVRDLVRTLECVYWVSGLGLALLAWSSIGYLANSWLQPETLTTETLRHSLALMVLVLAIQFPSTFYSGCLLGLQHHVVLNIITFLSSASAAFGSILVLWLVEPTLPAFFLWQAIARSVQTAVLASFVWHMLPTAARRPKFQFGYLKSIWRFAVGMSGISVLGLILTQIDNVLLSRLLPLEKFGYYSLAKSISQSLYIFITPIFTAVFPRFTQILATNNQSLLRQTYDRTTQLLAVFVISAGLTLSFLSSEVLWAWTGNAKIVDSTNMLVTVLCLGTAINGLMNPPYALQLAYGSTRLAVWTNILAVLVIVPLILFLAPKYGAISAALAWLFINTAMVIGFVPLTHARFLPVSPRWYLYNLARPIIPVAAMALTGMLLVPDPIGRLAAAFWVVGIFAVSSAAGIASVPWLRNALRARLLNRGMV